METEKFNYYSIIPYDVMFNNNLKDKAKLLYGQICGLSNEKGYCFASNGFLAIKNNTTEENISRLITSLVKNNHLRREIIYKNNTKEVQERRLYPLTIWSIPLDKSVNTPLDQNVKDNNKYMNNKYYIYGELKNVKLTEEQYVILKEKNLIDYIDKLSLYMESKGKKYKNHYATILTWSKKQAKIKNDKKIDIKKKGENSFQL